jgi:hypothetical protein
MAEFRSFKVATLPASPVPDAIYFVENGNYAEAYVTDDSGVAKMMGNSVMITQIAGTGDQEVQLYSTIATRDAATLNTNTIVLVTDATADSTVDSGAAMYFYDNTADSFIKVAEFESLDLQLTWSNITGRPTSSPASIDQAVSDSHSHTNKAILDGITDAGSGQVITATERNNLHSHTNKTQLDKIGETGGDATYNGEYIQKWETVNW